MISSRERGLYMGVQQTFGGTARVAFPILAGLAFDRLGMRWPFLFGAGLVLCTLLLGLGMESHVKEKSTSAPAAA